MRARRSPPLLFAGGHATRQTTYWIGKAPDPGHDPAAAAAAAAKSTAKAAAAAAGATVPRPLLKMGGSGKWLGGDSVARGGLSAAAGAAATLVLAQDSDEPEGEASGEDGGGDR